MDLLNRQERHREFKEFQILQDQAQKRAIPSESRIELSQVLINARKLIKFGDIDLALNMLKAANSRFPGQPRILSLLAETMEKFRSREEALVLRRELTRLEYNFKNIKSKAMLEFDMGRDQESLQTYFEALSMVEENDQQSTFEIYKNIGNIFLRQGDIESAEENYNKAHIINSHSDILLVNYGALEVQRGQLSAARERFRHAVQLNPQNDKAWAGLAMVHNEFGDHELAYGNINNALDLEPKNRTALLMLSHWSLRDHQPAQAIARLAEFLAGADFDQEMSLILIHLFCEQKEYALALIEVDRCLCWNPSEQKMYDLKEKIELMMAVV